MIIDIFDEFSTFAGQCFKRVKFYNKNNYDIQIFDTEFNKLPNTYCKSKKKKISAKTVPLEPASDSDFLPDSD